MLRVDETALGNIITVTKLYRLVHSLLHSFIKLQRQSLIGTFVHSPIPSLLNPARRLEEYFVQSS